MEQELSHAIRVRVGDIAMGIGRDMKIMQPHFPIADERKAVRELAVVLTKRAHLSTREHDARLVGFQDLVIVQRTTILRYERIDARHGYSPGTNVTSSSRSRMNCTRSFTHASRSLSAITSVGVCI